MNIKNMASTSDSKNQELLQQAQSGDEAALGELLEAYRPWLKVLAFRYLQGGLAARVDESDLVQQTCLSVHNNFKNFRGNQSKEFVAWLKQVHEGNIQNAVREHVHTKKRAVDREQGNQTVADLAANASSPSQRLLASEDAVRLAAELEKLVPDQREAVQLRYLEGFTLAEISEKMDRSHSSVVGLIQRGLDALRKQFQWD